MLNGKRQIVNGPLKASMEPPVGFEPTTFSLQN
jgi:hypothetical protein